MNYNSACQKGVAELKKSYMYSLLYEIWNCPSIPVSQNDLYDKIKNINLIVV